MSPNPPRPSVIKARKLDRYVGNHVVEAKAVQGAPTPNPHESWRPVPHWTVFELIRDQLTAAGFALEETLHSLYRGGARYIGLGITDRRVNGRDLVVGWFNAHDKSSAATLLLGEQVLVCFNLCLHGEVKVTRKHTRHIERDLPGLIARGVAGFGDHIQRHDRRTSAYEHVPLRGADGHDLLIRLLDARAFPPSRLDSVLQEWREPSVEAWREAWNVNRLYQAVTTQRTPLAAMAQRHRATHRVLDGYCDVT